MKPKVRTVKIEDVTVDPAANPRVALNEEHVADLMAAYTAEEDVPPPLCYEVGDDLKLSEGFHRWEALRRLKRIRLTVQVVTGTEDEWAAHTFGSNKGHGLKRTNPDKRRCVELFLNRFPRWADTRIADAAGVSNNFVGDVRKQYSNAGHSDGQHVNRINMPEEPEVRERRDGTTITLKPKAAKPVDQSPVTPARREPTPAEVNARGAFPFGHEAPLAELVAEATAEILTTSPTVTILPPVTADEAEEDDTKGGVPTKDANGIPIQPHALEAFQAVPHFRGLIVLLKRVRSQLTALADSPGGLHLQRRCRSVRTATGGNRWMMPELDNALTILEDAMPKYTDCAYKHNVHGEHPADCGLCKGLFWHGAVTKNRVSKEMTDAMLAHYGITPAAEDAA